MTTRLLSGLFRPWLEEVFIAQLLTSSSIRCRERHSPGGSGVGAELPAGRSTLVCGHRGGNTPGGRIEAVTVTLLGERERLRRTNCEKRRQLKGESRRRGGKNRVKLVLFESRWDVNCFFFFLKTWKDVEVRGDGVRGRGGWEEWEDADSGSATTQLLWDNAAFRLPTESKFLHFGRQ